MVDLRSTYARGHLPYCDASHANHDARLHLKSSAHQQRDTVEVVLCFARCAQLSDGARCMAPARRHSCKWTRCSSVYPVYDAPERDCRHRSVPPKRTIERERYALKPGRRLSVRTHHPCAPALARSPVDERIGNVGESKRTDPFWQTPAHQIHVRDIGRTALAWPFDLKTSAVIFRSDPELSR